MEFEPLNAKEQGNTWVTLLRCANLIQADLIATQLRAADIPVFIPDELLMQTISFNVNTFGYVRVQVPPSHYEESRQVLAATPVPGNCPEE